MLILLLAVWGIGMYQMYIMLDVTGHMVPNYHKTTPFLKFIMCLTWPLIATVGMCKDQGKKVTIAVIALCVIAVSGCDIDANLTPTVDPTTATIRPINVFDGVYNDTLYQFNIDDYTCNDADWLIYIDKTGLVLLNDDSTIAECIPYLYSIVSIQDEDVNIYEPVVEGI